MKTTTNSIVLSIFLIVILVFFACSSPKNENETKNSQSTTSEMNVWEPNDEIVENESKLWYGPSNAGINIVYEAPSIAYTEENPKVNITMTNQANKMKQALLQVADITYLAYGWDITSTHMIITSEGLIIIDPPMAKEAGEEMLIEFRKVTDKPVRAIVYTHNHIDHVAGVKAFTTEEEVASGKVDIYAHETMMNGVINWASTVGVIEGRRTSYTAATFLPKGPDGSVHDALGPDARIGTVTFIPPSKTFSDVLKLEIGGVKMELHHVPSETTDEIVAWFPDLKLLNVAEVMQGESFPNIYTIRGTKYRDPVIWFKGIDILRRFPAEILVGSHGRPIIGSDNIQNMLTAYRDAIQFVHDQTIRYMNQGYTPEELVEVVVLPDHLANHPWLGEHYGTVKHVVRNIYGGYLGWFQADPWTLDPLPYMERAKRYVELMGGREAVMNAARKAIEDKEFTWAAEILTNVIRIDNQDMEARNLKAEAYKGFAYGLYNVNWRNWTLTAVAELEGEVDISKGFSFTSADVIQSFPSNVMLPMITTRIDVEKSINTNMTLGITFTDEKKSFALEIRRGVVQFHESLPENIDVAITSTRTFMNKMLVGDVYITGEMSIAIAEGAPAGGVIMMDAIKNGNIKIDTGTAEDIKKFFSYFDPPVEVGKINLIVR